MASILNRVKTPFADRKDQNLSEDAIDDTPEDVFIEMTLQ